MDRYVIVNLLSGEALRLHEKIVEDVCFKFNVQRQKLPGHITLKAPFETDNIGEIEKVLQLFCSQNSKVPIKIEGINNFRNNVIYMDIHPSKEAIKLHENLYTELKKIDFLEWKPTENKNRTFHSTIVSRRIQKKFYDIWKYVNNYKFSFDTYIDNITIMKWVNSRWQTYKKFKL